MKSYNMKEASELLQVSYRTIRYYKGIFTNEVTQEGRDVQLSERFIELEVVIEKGNSHQK